MSDGRTLKGQATREELISVARDIFGEHGYEATSIATILDVAGVARGALYHHFATKTDLFDAVLEKEVAAIARDAAKAARPFADPLQSLRAGCEAFLRLALDPAVQRIALVEAPSVVGWVRWRELDEQYTLGGLRASIARFVDSGRVEPEQIDTLAHMVLAAVGEAAIMIATAVEPQAALQRGLAALDTLLNRLFG